MYVGRGEVEGPRYHTDFNRCLGGGREVRNVDNFLKLDRRELKVLSFENLSKLFSGSGKVGTVDDSSLLRTRPFSRIPILNHQISTL